MLAPVSVHADYFHQGIGSAMLKMGIEKVKEMGYKWMANGRTTMHDVSGDI